MEWKMIFSMLGMLVLMAAVLYGAYWVSRQVGKGYQLQNTQPGKIEILSRSMIGKEQMLLLVKSAGKVFLLGVTSESINMLSELDPAALPPEEAKSATPPDFMSILKSNLKKNGFPKGKSGGGTPS